MKRIVLSATVGALMTVMLAVGARPARVLVVIRLLVEEAETGLAIDGEAGNAASNGHAEQASAVGTLVVDDDDALVAAGCLNVGDLLGEVADAAGDHGELVARGRRSGGHGGVASAGAADEDGGPCEVLAALELWRVAVDHLDALAGVEW